MRNTRVGERPEAVAERHVAALEDLGPQAVGRMPLRQPHRGERGRIFAWVAALDLEAPVPHRPPRRLGGAVVAGEDVVEPLLVQHAERDLQTLQQVGRRRVGEIALFVRGDHLVPGPERPRQLRLLRGRERLVGDRVEGQARRQHQPLLRAADRDVDAPLVVAVVDRAERGDGVDEEERRMSGLVDRAADRGDARGDAGRGLVVDDRDGLDLARLVLGEPGLDRVRVHAGAPVALDELGTQAETGRHLVPQGREPAGLEHQHPVAGRQRVDERRLPGAGAGGRIDHDRVPGLEHRLDAGEHLPAEDAELRSAVVDRRLRDGGEHRQRRVRRSRDLQEVSARLMAHDGLPAPSAEAFACERSCIM